MKTPEQIADIVLEEAYGAEAMGDDEANPMSFLADDLYRRDLDAEGVRDLIARAVLIERGE